VKTTTGDQGQLGIRIGGERTGKSAVETSEFLMMIGLRTLGIVVAIVAPTLAMAAPSAAVRAACAPDARKLCGAVISNAEARHKCMVAHRAQLSEACKAALAEDKKAPAATGEPAGAAPLGGTPSPSETTAPPPAPSGTAAPPTK
jgi:hypothetical protein